MVDKKKTYQQMNEELNVLMAWFESEQVDLDQAVAKYEKVTALIAEMENYLKSTENKIKKIAAKP